MIGGGIARGLVRKATAAAIAAAAALVAVIAFGAAVFYALCLVITPLGAAVVTSLLFALIAAVITAVFLRREGVDHEDEDDEPVGIGERAFNLFRERPIMGTVAALAGGWMFLRNPALASLVAAAFTEKSHTRRRR